MNASIRGPVGIRHGWYVWENVTCVECPKCGFTFDADHLNTKGEGYSCPLCDDGLYEADQFDGDDRA